MRAYGIVIIALAAAATSVAIGNAAAAPPTVPVTGQLSAIEPATGKIWLAGLWDKPNQACMKQCQVFVIGGCFKAMAEKNPAADAASLQNRCEEKFSVCLYQCMCENCKNEEKKKAN